MWGLWCLALLFHSVMGHGYLAQPKARNVVFNSNFCPHCLNAGGSGATANGAHGICGDPYDGPRDHEEGGKYFSDEPQATYRRGQDAEFKLVISANHHGRFSFRICEYTGSENAALTEACLDKNVLRMSAGEQAPGKEYWYTGPNDPPQKYTMRYKLPKDLTCDGVRSKCVLQWYWSSMNSCILQDPDPPAEFLPGSNMSKCGPGNARGEAFWNCAQIRITEDGDGSGGSGSGDDDVPMPLPADLSELDPPTGEPTDKPTPEETSNAPSPSKPAGSKPGKKKKKPGKKKKKPGKKKKKPGKKKPLGKPSKTGKPSSESQSSSAAAKDFCGKRGRKDGFYAAPGSTGFFRCDPTGAFFFSCPGGTAWNDQVNLCDWA